MLLHPLLQLGKYKGSKADGEARANALATVERRATAQQGAEARWTKKL